MAKLNKNGEPRKKRVTKQMIMAKNRKNGQKKAWATRRAKYGASGLKPKGIEEGKLLGFTERELNMDPELKFLRERERELHEVITALQHDLKLAKKTIEEMTAQQEEMQNNFLAPENDRIKELEHTNAILQGKLLGFEACFGALAEEINQ